MDEQHDHSSAEIENVSTSLLEHLGKVFESHHASLVERGLAIRIHKLLLGLRLWRNEVFNGHRSETKLERESTRKLVWSLCTQAQDLTTDIGCALESSGKVLMIVEALKPVQESARSDSDELADDIDSLEATLRCMNDLLPSILDDEIGTEQLDRYHTSVNRIPAEGLDLFTKTDPLILPDAVNSIRKTILLDDFPPSPAPTSRRSSIDEVLYKPQVTDRKPTPPNHVDFNPLYSYSPLRHERCIRLVKLYPANTSEEPVHCDLIQVPLKKARRIYSYEALAWLWGAEISQTITIYDGGARHFFATDDRLHEALVALRLVDSPRYLWIDVICIDKNNIVERSTQVQLMSEIYRLAVNVCVWLGPETEDTTMAVDLISRVLTKFIFEDLLTRQYLRNWTALVELMKNPWYKRCSHMYFLTWLISIGRFGRRWSVQAIALARQATIHVGNACVQWEDFAAAVSLLDEVESSTRKLSALARQENTFHYVDRFFDEIGTMEATVMVNITNRIFRKWSDGRAERVFSLESLVSRLAYFRSTDVRDVIYAAVPLAKDCNFDTISFDPDIYRLRGQAAWHYDGLTFVNRMISLISHKHSFDTDYSKAPVEVYQQFIAFAISNAQPSRALDVICRPFAPSSLELHLPTWVPCLDDDPFEMRREEQRAPRARRIGDLFVSLPDETSHYSACGNRKHNRPKTRFRKRSSHYSMYVEGFVIDTIQEVHSPSELGNIPESWIRKKLEYDQIDSDVFWRVLVANRSPTGKPPAYYKRVIQSALDSAVFGASFNIMRYIGNASSHIVSTTLQQVHTLILGRCLLQTHGGHIGLGPKKLHKLHFETSSHLKVCILHGCSVPVILREVEKTTEGLEQEFLSDQEDVQERVTKVLPITRAIWKSRHIQDTQAPISSPIDTSDGRTSAIQKSTIPTSATQTSSIHTLKLVILLFALIVFKNSTTDTDYMIAYALPLFEISAGLQGLHKNRRDWKLYSSLREYLLIENTLLLLSLRLYLVISPFYYFHPTSLFWEDPQAWLTEAIYLELLFIARRFLSRKFEEILAHRSTEMTLLTLTRKLRAFVLHKSSDLIEDDFIRGTGIDKTVTVEPEMLSSSQLGESNLVPGIRDRPQVYYELVGECYVHGMMNGEAIEWQESVLHSSPEGRTQIFEIR